VQAKPTKSQSQEKFGVPETAVEPSGRLGRKHVFGLQTCEEQLGQSVEYRDIHLALRDEVGSRHEAAIARDHARVLVGYLEQHVERID
jgi:hypothetical protein